MRRMQRIGTLALMVSLAATAAWASTAVSDQAGAIVVYPLVANLSSTDTVIQLSNTSDQPVGAKCYYVNTAGACSVSGSPCFASSTPSPCPLPADVCVPGWVETDFHLWLTPQQPLAWLASRGMSRKDLPLDGTFRPGPNGASNVGTAIPPFVRSSLFPYGLGELKCYAINPDGTPSERNVLKGEAALEDTDSADVGKSNAIGFRAIPGANNGDNQLQLGGDGAEYDGCPSVLILDHFFDGATDPVSGREVFTVLVAIPCTENFVTQAPTRVTAQFLVFNEFEQRFSTSRAIDCWDLLVLSQIDTPTPSRSIFSVFVSGTLTGQTRIRGVQGGLLAVALEAHNGSSASEAMFNLQYQGQRDSGDVLTVVP